MLKQPVGFVKLTNVALVRHRVRGKRFELACYPNKIVDWRNGHEREIAEVLQSDEIYANVEQGELARASDLRECFGPLGREEIIRLVLDKGELQVTQKEREALAEALHKEVLKLVSDRVVYRQNRRPLPPEQVRAALKQIGFQPNINRPAKKQAADCVRLLEEGFNVARRSFLLKAAASPALLEELCGEGVEVLQTGEEGTLCVVGSKAFPRLEAGAKERLIALQIIDSEHYNKEPRGLDEGEVFLQRLDQPVPPAAPAEQPAAPAPAPAAPQGLSCATCAGVAFAAKADYREHLKSPWHAFNLTAKLKGQPALAQDKFEEVRLLLEMGGEQPAKGRKRRA